MDILVSLTLKIFLAPKPGTGSSGGDGMAVERHPVSILNEYGQKKGVKVSCHLLH